jgi:hypothetical protein
MMRTTLACLALALSFVCAAPLAAQDKSQDKKAPPKPKTISLSGCVVRDERIPTQFTLEDKADGGTYRLTGINMSDYVGRRVQIGGAIPDSKKLVIKGGLTPSANVAAQAGDMDPARAAMATQGGAAGPGIVNLPEFRVKSVRPVSGGCPN